MTQISAIASSLLKGETLSIMDGYRKFACTNLPREISRSIEQKFGVRVDKTPTAFKSRYGQTGSFYRYKLPQNQLNKEGIEKMKQYIKENS